MAGKAQIHWPPDAELLAWRRGGLSEDKIAARVGCSRSAVQHRLRKLERNHGPDPVGVIRHEDGTASVTTSPSDQPPAPWKPEELLEAHGLDPEEWRIVRVRGNRWGEPDEPKHQLRVDVVPRELLIEVPDPTAWKPPPQPRKRKKRAGEPRHVFICGDHHCPSHDKVLHQLFCERLAEAEPDEGVILGDLLDLPTVSQHRRKKGVTPPTVNECLRAAFGVLMDYRSASPNTRWTLLPGNHDDRLDNYQIDYAPSTYEVTAADDDVPALSLRRLLHLDELGIELIDGNYNRAKYLLGRKLSLRHGYLAGKNAADKMLAKISRSVVQGHTHRLRLVYATAHDEQEDHPTSTRIGAEAGTMAEIAAGLEYADEPDWQQGYLEAHLWADDDFSLEPAVYVPGRLLAPGGRRYSA